MQNQEKFMSTAGKKMKFWKPECPSTNRSSFLQSRILDEHEMVISQQNDLKWDKQANERSHKIASNFQYVHKYPKAGEILCRGNWPRVWMK